MFFLPHVFNRASTDFEPPFYLYDAASVLKQIDTLKEAFKSYPHLSIHYAVKANSNTHLLKFMRKHGVKADVVSHGEIERCLKAGYTGADIVMSGVGKTLQTLCYAANLNLSHIAVESVEELETLIALNKKVSVCLRLNPNINPGTHKKITTGLSDNKFGIPLSQIDDCLKRLKHQETVNFLGFSVHLGSQLWDISAYRAAFDVVASYIRKAEQFGFKVTRIDLGGGFGVDYTWPHPCKEFSFSDYVTALDAFPEFKDCELIIEPGRFLVATAGVLLTRVLYVKKTPNRTFLVIDAGMNDLMRPALYDAQHPIIPVNNLPPHDLVAMDVVGPVCESSDVFARNLMLPSTLKTGDLIAIGYTGAYGAALSSTYNSRDLVAEMWYENEELSVIRQKLTTQDLINLEIQQVLP